MIAVGSAFNESVPVDAVRTGGDVAAFLQVELCDAIFGDDTRSLVIMFFCIQGKEDRIGLGLKWILDEIVDDVRRGLVGLSCGMCLGVVGTGLEC